MGACRARSPYVWPQRRRFARWLGAQWAGTALVVFVLKAVIRKPRPAGLPLWGTKPTDFSLPSGHAAGAFVFAAFVLVLLLGEARARRERWRWGLALAALAGAASVAASRVYLGVHDAVDVAAGAIVGSLVGFSCGLRYRAAERCAPVPADVAEASGTELGKRLAASGGHDRTVAGDAVLGATPDCRFGGPPRVARRGPCARGCTSCAIIEEPSRLPPPPCSTRPSRRSMWASRPTAWTFTLSTRASTRTPARVNPPRSSRTSTRRCSQGACRSRPQASYRTSCSRCPCGRRPACEVGSNGRPEDSAPPRGRRRPRRIHSRRWKAVERNARALCARARNTATARSLMQIHACRERDACPVHPLTASRKSPRGPPYRRSSRRGQAPPGTAHELQAASLSFSGEIIMAKDKEDRPVNDGAYEGGESTPASPSSVSSSASSRARASCGAYDAHNGVRQGR